MDDRVVGVHQVVLDSSQTVQNRLSEDLPDEVAAWTMPYLKMPGNFRNMKRFIEPIIPGSLGLTQTRRQTQAPIKK